MEPKNPQPQNNFNLGDNTGLPPSTYQQAHYTNNNFNPNPNPKDNPMMMNQNNNFMQFQQQQFTKPGNINVNPQKYEKHVLDIFSGLSDNINSNNPNQKTSQQQNQQNKETGETKPEINNDFSIFNKNNNQGDSVPPEKTNQNQNAQNMQNIQNEQSQQNSNINEMGEYNRGISSVLEENSNPKIENENVAKLNVLNNNNSNNNINDGQNNQNIQNVFVNNSNINPNAQNLNIPLGSSQFKGNDNNNNSINNNDTNNNNFSNSNMNINPMIVNQMNNNNQMLNQNISNNNQIAMSDSMNSSNPINNSQNNKPIDMNNPMNVENSMDISQKNNPGDMNNPMDNNQINNNNNQMNINNQMTNTMNNNNINMMNPLQNNNQMDLNSNHNINQNNNNNNQMNINNQMQNIMNNNNNINMMNPLQNNNNQMDMLNSNHNINQNNNNNNQMDMLNSNHNINQNNNNNNNNNNQMSMPNNNNNQNNNIQMNNFQMGQINNNNNNINQFQNIPNMSNMNINQNKNANNLMPETNSILLGNANNNMKSDNNINANNNMNDNSNMNSNNNINIPINPQIKSIKAPYSFSRYKKASRTTLKNLGEKSGDTSYLNAVLQLLGTSRSLSNYFLNPNNTKFFVDNMNISPFAFVLYRLFTHFYPYPEKSDPEIYEPETLKTILGTKNKIYETKNRRNPNDLIHFILNYLHREINLIKTQYLSTDVYTDKQKAIDEFLDNYGKSNKSIISLNFVWFQIKSQKCTKCQTNFYSLQNYETLDLDLSNFYTMKCNFPLTIGKCLEFQTNKQQRLFCESCQIYNMMNITTRIYSLPNYLVFSLNRESNAQNINLLNVPFKVEEIIELSNYIEYNQSFSKYELQAIVSISLQENNKYVCFGKSPVDHTWYLYNDEKCGNGDINIVLNLNNNNQGFIPCILFYKAVSKSK